MKTEADQLYEAIANLMGAFDNPLYRRRLASDSFAKEAIEFARPVMEAAKLRRENKGNCKL